MLKDERLQKKEQVIEYLRRFPFYKWAAKFVGRDEDTLEKWRKDDPDFGERVEIARSEGIRYWGGRATPDLILKSADPETFRERKEVDITTKGEILNVYRYGDRPVTVANTSNGQQDKV